MSGTTIRSDADPPPCDGCPHQQHCAEQLTVCTMFTRWADSGIAQPKLERVPRFRMKPGGGLRRVRTA